MTVKGQKADKERELDQDFGRRGKNGNWPGCTEDFVNRTEKRRAKNKAARKSRKRNRK